MKKADRKSRYGGTNKQRAAGGSWLNWHVGRGRIALVAPDRVFYRYRRSVSWRRAL